MEVAEALRISEQNFPNGPEALAHQLNIKIYYNPLVGCEGWLLSTKLKTIIQINNNVPETRQRFTLAHELGHFLLGGPSIIGETAKDFFSSNKKEEKQVNDIASHLLLPESFILSNINELPVLPKTIIKIAEKANVSPMVVALRITKIVHKLGILGAIVVNFQNNQYDWQFSNNHSITVEDAQNLLIRCKYSDPLPVWEERKTFKDVMVASTIENPHRGTFLMLIQILEKKHFSNLMREERIRELEWALFSNDDQFRMEMSGCFGHFKNKAKNLNLSEAVRRFNIRYFKKWSGERDKKFKGQLGQEYIRLKLSRWYKDTY